MELETLRQYFLELAEELQCLSPYSVPCHAMMGLAVIQPSRVHLQPSSRRLKHFSKSFTFLSGGKGLFYFILFLLRVCRACNAATIQSQNSPFLAKSHSSHARFIASILSSSPAFQCPQQQGSDQICRHCQDRGPFVTPWEVPGNAWCLHKVKTCCTQHGIAGRHYPGISKLAGDFQIGPMWNVILWHLYKCD